MITRSDYETAQRRAAAILRKTGVRLREYELARISVADFGLGELPVSGAQILTLLDTEEIAVKMIVLFPGQTLPEHRHPPLGEYPGKAETLRCEWGTAYLYTPGAPTSDPQAKVPEHRHNSYTVWNEHILHPGDQITLPPNQLHWFQGGPQSAVVWSFSSRAVDTEDIFTDPDIERETIIIDDGP